MMSSCSLCSLDSSLEYLFGFLGEINSSSLSSDQDPSKIQCFFFPEILECNSNCQNTLLQMFIELKIVRLEVIKNLFITPLFVDPFIEKKKAVITTRTL